MSLPVVSEKAAQGARTFIPTGSYKPLMGVSNGDPLLQVAREAKCRTWIFIYSRDFSEGDNNCVREAGPTLRNSMITLGFNQQNDTK